MSTASRYALVEMTKEDRIKYLEARIAQSRNKKEIRAPSPRPINDISQIDYGMNSIVPPGHNGFYHEWTTKKAKVIVADNHIEFPRLFFFFDPEGEDYEGIGGPEGLVYDPPNANDSKNEDSVTVFLTYRLMRLSWGLRDYAEQEISARPASPTCLQEDWFPAHVNDEGYVVYSPWHIPIVKCSKRGILHGNQIIPAHEWSAERYSCSVLMSYAIEGVARGWAW